MIIRLYTNGYGHKFIQTYDNRTTRGPINFLINEKDIEGLFPFSIPFYYDIFVKKNRVGR